MRIDKNTTIRLGNRNIVKVKLGDVVIWQKTTEPVVEPEYFYIESLTDGNTVKLITNLRNTPSSSYLTPTIEYSTDKQNWTTITFDWSTTGIKNINIPVVLNTGDKMYFRNDTGKFSRTIYHSSSYETSYITFTTDWNGRVNVGGDIRTLINYRNVDNTILEDGMFSNLFSHTYGGTTTAKIVDASNLKLPFTEMTRYCYYQMFDSCYYLTSTPELPATTLATSCYDGMFWGCSSLTTLPELPATTLATRCYENMFRGCSKLTTAPTLPATTLADYCYDAMFMDCSSLTTAPELPATTLASGCYDSMFYGCTSLTTAPALPATTLTSVCYENMFKGCTKLTTAPTLPATTLQYACYRGMFGDCTSLTTAPALPATTLNNECYQSMFSGCTSLTTAPTLPSTTLANYCYSYMFQKCTSLTTAPTLPATTLVNYCYSSMFDGCTSLNKVLTYADDISTSNCTTNWLNNVAATGTFYNAGSAVYTTDNPSGIPTGWTEVTTVPTTTSVYAVPNTFTAKSWMDKVKLNYTIMGVNETGIDVPLGEQNELITIGKNTGSSTVTHTETLTYDGLNYTITINQTANDTDEPDYFYIESLGDGNTISVKNQGDGSTSGVTPTLEYSKDKNTWNTITFDWASGEHTTELPIKLNTGEKMYFRNDTRLFSNSSSKYISFSSSVSSNVGGDIRTLSNYLDVNSETKPQTYMFYYLFYNNKIVDASNLRLPYTTLASSCYQYMFNGCTSLTTAPELPATTLADYCYHSMFNGCSSLTTAPELPATTLAYYCYFNMFSGCKSLTSAPALLSTTLAGYCYMYMFDGCSSLNTAPQLPATTLVEYCYFKMFKGCTSLTTAPELPATTLADYCYQSMFSGCTSLTSVTIYAETTASGAFYEWLSGVSSSGTVYNNGFLDLPKNSASGVPSGWTEVVPPIQSITANPDTFTIEFNNETVTCNSTLEVVTTVGTFTKTNSATLTVGENTGNTTRTLTETIPYYNSSYDVTIVQSAIQSITANPDTFTIKSYKDTAKCTSTLTIATTLGTTVTDTNTATITVGENTGDTTRTLTETIPYKGSSYQVTIVQTANDVKPPYEWNVESTGTYPFQLNTNGYYESTNKGHDSSYSYATLNYQGFENLVLECINSGESNYDYGIISQPDVLLSESIEDDGATGSTKVFKNFKGESSTNPVQITIPSADDGSHFITIKFRKDSSQAQDNDSLQFKVIEP